MSESEPVSPLDPDDRPAPSELSSPKPEWLMGSDEGASRATRDESPRRPTVPGRAPKPGPDARDTARLSLVGPGAGLAPPESEPGAGDPPPSGPVAWKAAASSVPKLREQPVAALAPTDAEGEESFVGFAQDGVVQKAGAASGTAQPDTMDEMPDEALPDEVTPLDRDPGFLVNWLDRARFLRHPIALAIGGVLVVVAVGAQFLMHHESGGVSLAQIRQQPEAFEGRPVFVAGRAGEAYSIGGSYVFDLYQGRDTIVVYSRTRRPGLHEDVKVRGSVSIGYLDGQPRVAVFEDTAKP